MRNAIGLIGWRTANEVVCYAIMLLGAFGNARYFISAFQRYFSKYLNVDDVPPSFCPDSDLRSIPDPRRSLRMVHSE